MSFQTSIAGACPSNNFTFTTSNVSSDNISCTNLSATNASIGSLSVTTFSPVNINTSLILADDIHASNISTTTINSSLSTTQELIATSGTINTFYSGFIESVGALITDIQTDDLIAGHIHVSNISLDNTLGGHTANLVQINAQNINAIITDSFYVNASQLSVTETANIYTVNASNVSAISVSATTLTGRIDGNLAAGQGIALTQVGNVTTITNTGQVTDPLTIGTINVSNLSCDQLHVSNISLDGTLGGFKANLVEANILTAHVSTIYSVNISNELHISSKYLHGDIFSNLASGTGISLSLHNGITTITNIAGTSDPLNINTLNGSTINSSHIYNSSIITTAGLITSTIHASVIHCEQRLDLSLIHI